MSRDNLLAPDATSHRMFLRARSTNQWNNRRANPELRPLRFVLITVWHLRRHSSAGELRWLGTGGSVAIATSAGRRGGTGAGFSFDAADARSARPVPTLKRSQRANALGEGGRPGNDGVSDVIYPVVQALREIVVHGVSYHPQRGPVHKALPTELTEGDDLRPGSLCAAVPVRRRLACAQP